MPLPAKTPIAATTVALPRTLQCKDSCTAQRQARMHTHSLAEARNGVPARAAAMCEDVAPGRAGRAQYGNKPPCLGSWGASPFVASERALGLRTQMLLTGLAARAGGQDTGRHIKNTRR